MHKLLVTALVVVIPAAAGRAAPRDQATEAPIDPALAGRHHYESFCSSCHGDEARGDGPLAELLRIVTPDLTRLAERHDGEFPAPYVKSRIDGTEAVQAHGRRMMPVWGQALGPASGRSERETAGRQIAEIVAYLETIQETD
jgi:hypothetical protein